MDKTKFAYEQVADALRKNKGFVSYTAKYLGITNQTIYNYLERWPELKNIQNEAREEMLDFAETKLLDLMKDKNPTALIFYLKTQGKNRGYVENIVINKDNSNLKISNKDIEQFKDKFRYE